MLIPEIYYTHAKGQGWIKKECEIVDKKCTYCNCPEYYVKGNIAYTKVEKV